MACCLKSLHRTVTEILHREEEFVDMSDEDRETKSAGQDFRERGTVGTAMETLGHRFIHSFTLIMTVVCKMNYVITLQFYLSHPW